MIYLYRGDNMIAIYSRKSKFTGKGESVENQVEMCRDYVKTLCKQLQSHLQSLIVKECNSLSTIVQAL